MSSTARSLALLRLFRPDRPALSAQEIAALTGTTLSTVYRDLAHLRDLGLVEGHRGETFILGGGLSVLDRQARLADPLRTAVFPEMQRLADETGQTITLTRLYGSQLLGVDHLRGVDELSIGYERGELVPLFRGCSGKVILSVLPWRRLKAIWAEAQGGIVAAGLGGDWAAFLDTVRGYRRSPALWTAGEVIPGNTAVAVPLADEALGLAASITVILRDETAREIDRDALAARLLAARDRAGVVLKGEG